MTNPMTRRAFGWRFADGCRRNETGRAGTARMAQPVDSVATTGAILPRLSHGRS